MEKDIWRKYLVFVIIMLFVWTGIIPNTVRDASASDEGLVGYWNFDEGSGSTAYDSSGNGNDGAIHGATWTTGISGGALSFDGVDDYVEVLDSPSLNPTSEITLEAWYKTVSFVGHGNTPIIDKGYEVHVEPYYQYHLGVTGDEYDPPGKYAEFTFSVVPGGVVSGYGFWTAGNWYHIAGTYDGVVAKLYVNGNLIYSEPASGAMRNYGKNVYFGKFTNTKDCLPGIIDEVHIYSRALTASEIQDHYEEYMPSDGLGGHWHFDEDTGNIAYDSSGYGNHGTIHGATWATGISGNALSFDGISDYVDCGNDPSLDITDDITIEVWAKFNSVPINTPVHFVSKDEGNEEEYKWIFCYAQNYHIISNALVFHINGPDYYYPHGGEWPCSSSWTPTVGKWYHVAVVKNNNDYTFYLNGVNHGEYSATYDIPPVNAHVTIGAASAEGDPIGESFFDGVIDEVRIYNHALSTSEILEHYNEFNGENIKITGLSFEPNPVIREGVPGGEILIIANIKNLGENTETGDIIVKADGNAIYTKEVTLDSGETTEHYIDWTPIEYGDYTITATPGNLGKSYPISVSKLEGDTYILANYGLKGLVEDEFEESSDAGFWTGTIISMIHSAATASKIVGITGSALSMLGEIVRTIYEPTTWDLCVYANVGGNEKYYHSKDLQAIYKEVNKPISTIIVYGGGKYSPHGQEFNFKVIKSDEYPHSTIVDFDIECPFTYYDEGFFVIYPKFDSISEPGVYDIVVTHEGKSWSLAVEVSEGSVTNDSITDTSGFELILIVCAVALVLFWKRKWRS